MTDTGAVDACKRLVSEDDPRVVIVDDVEVNVAVLTRMLATFGITTVATTSDSRQAVQLVQSFQPDLVLLDLHMPGMTGPEVLAALSAVVPQDDYLPVIVLTADESRAAKETALSVGAHDFVSKPLDRSEVELRIRNLLRTRWLYQRLRQHTESLQAQVRAQQEQARREAEERQRTIARIRAVLAGAGLLMHFQPIVSLQDGVRLAVDDAGAGFASLRHILRLRPDIIKIDLELTRGIDADPARRALASALVTFAAEMSAVVVAEGVETAGELAVLRDIGANAAQGFYLGRPQPPPLGDVYAGATELLGAIGQADSAVRR